MNRLNFIKTTALAAIATVLPARNAVASLDAKGNITYPVWFKDGIIYADRRGVTDVPKIVYGGPGRRPNARKILYINGHDAKELCRKFKPGRFKIKNIYNNSTEEGKDTIIV